LVKEGRELKDKKNYTKALKQFGKGLKLLVDYVSHDIPKDSDKELSGRVDTYLAEAEELKLLAHPTAQTAQPPPAQSPQGPTIDVESSKQIDKGQQLLNEAEDMEGKGQTEQSCKIYIEGLQTLMAVMADKRYKDHPSLASVRARVGQCIERAEKLKSRQPGASGGSSGGTDRRSSQDAGRRSSRDRDRDRRGDRRDADDRGGHHGRGGRERSRSRDRPRHDSSHARGGSDAHRGGRHRSRSRSRGGSSRKDASSAQARARGASPPKVQEPATRPKGLPASRPPALDEPQTQPVRPKSGAALLVGKAKASVKR